MLWQTLFGHKSDGSEPDAHKLSDASLLDRCLQAMEQGEDVRGLLRRYPDRAGRIRPLLDMATYAQEHYENVPEPPGGLVSGRVRVLQAAAAQAATAAPQGGRQSQRTRRPLRQVLWHLKVGLSWRWVGAALLILLALVPLAPRIAHAASQSVPGGLLYGIKLTSEDFHFVSVADPELRVVLSLALMDERVEELKAMAVKHKPIPDVVLRRMIEFSEEALVSAAAASDQAMPGLLEFIAYRTEAQADALVGLMVYAEPTQHNALLQAQATCWRTYQVAVMASSAPQTFRQMYQGVEVDKALALPGMGDAVELDKPGNSGKP